MLAFVQAYLQKITEEEARKYFHQLIDAVDYCHGRNVYHGDLKVCSLTFNIYENCSLYMNPMRAYVILVDNALC